MGNCGLGRHAYCKQVVKLVHSNGLIEEFYRPLKAGELLIDYPDHFICHADGLSQLLSNGLLARLSEEDDMDIGQIYFLLPKRMLDTTPSYADVAILISRASTARKASYRGSQLGPLPLPARHGSYGHNDNDEEEDDDDDDDDEKENEELDRAVSRAFVRRVLAEAKLQMEKRTAADPSLGKQLGSNPELQSAFTSHLVAKSCARLWRPPLDTIYEEASSITI